MPIRNPSTLVSFDAEAAHEAVRDAAGDGLQVCAEYTTDDFNLLYLADAIIAEYGSPEAVLDAGEDIHRYLHLDFEEEGLFDDLYPPVETAYGFVTYTDHVVVVRVVGDGEGLYCSVDHDVDVDAVVEAAREHVRGPGSAGA